MAQIIKHRRGSLESISGATKRAGELLVVTGSAGIICREWKFASICWY
jgi:hypothetical protein